MSSSTMPWPTDITAMNKGRVLEVAFDDGEVIRLTAEKLRVESPSAEVQGHSPSQKRTVTGKENVAIAAIEPVGNYAIKIVFDDGHDTGLYTWVICASWRLRAICRLVELRGFDAIKQSTNVNYFAAWNETGS